MTITINSPDFAPTEQLLWVQKQILGDIKHARQEGVKAGMLDKKGPYELYERQRGGSVRKRKENTLNPKFMKAGTAARPTEYEYITGGDWQTVVDAARDAWQMLLRISPRDTGNYLSLMHIYANDRLTTVGGLDKLNNTQGARVNIVNVAPYAVAVEHGFYVGRYDKGRYKGSGVYLQVAREIRRQYGNKISLRFYFLSFNGGTVPAIEIAAAGEFAGNDSTPGRGGRRRRKRRG